EGVHLSFVRMDKTMCAVANLVNKRNPTKASHPCQRFPARSLKMGSNPGNHNNLPVKKDGTAHPHHGGKPSHSATWYNATKLMEKATSPATITPPTTMRMNCPESGLIRFGWPLCS